MPYCKQKWIILKYLNLSCFIAKRISLVLEALFKEVLENLTTAKKRPQREWKSWLHWNWGSGSNKFRWADLLITIIRSGAIVR
jgi:hypothetical protein